MKEVISIEDALNYAKTIHGINRQKVFFICQSCGKKEEIILKNFVSGRKNNLLCRKCATKQTTMEKYGVDNILKDKEIRKTISEKRTGIPLKQTPKVIENKAAVKEKTLKRIHDEIETKYNIIRLGEYKGTGCKNIYQWKCNVCGNIFSFPARYDNPILCDKCFPETRFQKTAQTKINNEKERIKKYLENRYGTTLLDEYKGKAFINSKGLKENYLYNWKCGACGQNFKAAVRFDRNLSCPNCNPFQHGSSKGQKELTEDLSVYGLKIIPMDREVLNGKEIDIYFPDLKFGIEYDGAYWHNEEDDKNKDFLAKEKGIEIYRIDDKEFSKNKTLVEEKLINYIETKYNKKLVPIKEISKSRTFSKGREVECNGIIYKNVDDASEKTGVGKSQIYNSCRTGHKAHGRFFSWHKIS